MVMARHCFVLVRELDCLDACRAEPALLRDRPDRAFGALPVVRFLVVFAMRSSVDDGATRRTTEAPPRTLGRRGRILGPLSPVTRP